MGQEDPTADVIKERLGWARRTLASSVPVCAGSLDTASLLIQTECAMASYLALFLLTLAR